MIHKRELKKISVIVPVYNVEQYLAQCIQSLIEQTYQNIEIILVDDGSTDNSREICLSFAEQDSRVKYIYQDNAGAAVARNNGLNHAKGDYIGFVDSDDYIDPDMYEVMLNHIIKYQADVAQILSRRVNNNGIILNQSLIEQNENKAPIFYSAEEAIQHYLLGNHALWSHLYHASLFDSVRIPERMIDEDLAVIIPLYQQIEKVVKIHQYKYNYRLNTESVTHGKLDNRRINTFFEFERQLDIYKGNQLYEQLLLNMIFKTLVGIINEIILKQSENISYDEVFFKNKIIEYYDRFVYNDYISEKQLRKINLYLKSRLVYLVFLKIKRKYLFTKPAFGEE